MLNWLRTISGRRWFRGVWFTLAYLGLGLISNEISLSSASFQTIWLPGGLFVAVLLCSDVRDWPVFLLASLPGSLLISLVSGLSLYSSILAAVIGPLEAAAGAWLASRFVDDPNRFNSPRHILTCSFFPSFSAPHWLRWSIRLPAQFCSPGPASGPPGRSSGPGAWRVCWPSRRWCWHGMRNSYSCCVRPKPGRSLRWQS